MMPHETDLNQNQGDYKNFIPVYLFQFLLHQIL